MTILVSRRIANRYYLDSIGLLSIYIIVDLPVFVCILKLSSENYLVINKEGLDCTPVMIVDTPQVVADKPKIIICTSVANVKRSQFLCM